MTQTMTKQQLAQLRKQLEELRDDISGELRLGQGEAADENYRDIAGEVHDRGEEAVGEQLAKMNTELKERRLYELREIRAALGRVEDGQYGVCMDCGEEIGFDRLEAYPMAKRCFDCKVRFESSDSGVERRSPPG